MEDLKKSVDTLKKNVDTLEQIVNKLVENSMKIPDMRCPAIKKTEIIKTVITEENIDLTKLFE
jgi:hypothetical protein